MITWLFRQYFGFQSYARRVKLVFHTTACIGHANSRWGGRASAEQVQEHSPRRGQFGGVPRHPQEGGGDSSTIRWGGGKYALRKPAGRSSILATAGVLIADVLDIYSPYKGCIAWQEPSVNQPRVSKADNDFDVTKGVSEADQQISNKAIFVTCQVRYVLQ